MNKNEALKILKHYNLWRRDKNEINQYEMPNPTDIGLAIDIAIAELSKLLSDEIQ